MKLRNSIAVLLTSLIFFIASPAMAESAGAEWYWWTIMQKDSNGPGADSLERQCELAASQDAGDNLTPATCDKLVAAFNTENYRVVMVPDGTGTAYTYLGGPDGKMFRHMAKNIGRSDRALVFEVDGITFHWFHGAATSCNNLGVVAKVAVPSPEQIRWLEGDGGMEVISIPADDYRPLYVSGIEVCGETVIPGQVLVIPQ